MKPPELSFVITSYKNPEMLKMCLESLREHVRNIEHEIIVADSAADTENRALMRQQFPSVHYFPFENNVGFSRLVRQGLDTAIGEYIFLMNADILINPGAIEALLAYYKSHPGIGMLGPKLLNFNDSFQPSCFRFYRPLTILYRRTFLGRLPFAERHLNWFLMKDYDHRNPKEVDWLMGSAMLVSRKAVEKVGSMDHRYFMYMEDVDWCRRFWEAGYKVVYYPLVEFYHYHGKGSAKGGFWRSLLFNRLTWEHIKSAVKYFWKFRNKPAPQHD